MRLLYCFHYGDLGDNILLELMGYQSFMLYRIHIQEKTKINGKIYSSLGLTTETTHKKNRRHLPDAQAGMAYNMPYWEDIRHSS